MTDSGTDSGTHSGNHSGSRSEGSVGKGVGQLHAQEEVLSSAMRKAQLGDSIAYGELLEAVRVVLLVYVSRYLKRMGIQDESITEDRVQEILLALHTKRHTYDPAQLFTPWLFAIARYKLIDFGRHRRTEVKSTAIPIEDMEDILEAPVFLEPTTASDLKILMDQLPEKSRRLLEMVKIDSLSIAEAAVLAQMSESAVKVNVHRAMKTLQGLINKNILRRNKKVKP